VKKELSTIHPELQAVARKMPAITYSRKNLWLMNWVMRLRPAPKTPADILIENIFIPAQTDQTRIRLRIYKPRLAGVPTPALIWLHGGGYVLGNPEQDDECCAQYGRELGITVVSVDYHYAPKYPFPIGLEDSYAALAWVAAQAQSLSVDIQRIAIGGASAGGGLAAALAQLAHDRQAIQPVFQLMVYPMLDDRTVIRPDLAGKAYLAWDQPSNRFGWESYLGRPCGGADLPEYAVPARRADLSGLPPAWLGVGTQDLFHDEDAAYAQRLKACAVPCEIEIVPGAFHGFDVFDPKIPLVQAFRRSQIAALRKYLFP
jgi:acetyl esterase/lipase